MKNLMLFTATLLSFCFLFSCATVPISGRQQANFGANKYLNKTAASQYRSIIANSKLCDDVEKVQMVRRVSNKIIAAASRYYVKNGMSKQFNSFKWEINLIENPAVNAFCMPGGKIAVFTGILAIIENEDQLAAVIGHEVAHALAHHSREQRSHGIMAEFGQIGVQVATANKSAEIRQAADAGYTVGAILGFMLPYSRKLEKEADQIGLRLMAMAGYDPEAAADFWIINTERFGDANSAFFHTHPTNRTRRKEIVAQIPQALAFAKPYLEQPEPNQDSPTLIVSSPADATRNTGSSQQTSNMTVAGMGFKKSNQSDSPAGEYFVVQLETVPDFSKTTDRYHTLNNLGEVYPEEAIIDGKAYDRILLGHFNHESQARSALKAAKEKGFSKAFLVEYANGRRGNWLR